MATNNKAGSGKSGNKSVKGKKPKGRNPGDFIIKKNETVRLIGKENFKMDRPRLIISSLAINLLSLALPIITLQVYDRIIASGNESTLNVLAVGVLIAIFVESTLRLTRSYVTGWAGAAFEHRISCEAIKHMLKADIEDVEKQTVGEYMNRMESISKLREFYSGYALMTLIDLPFVFIFIGLVAYFAGPLVLVPLTLLGIFVAVAWNDSRSIRDTLVARDKRDEERYNFIIETLMGIHTVKSGTYESTFMRKYENLQRHSSAINYDVALQSGRAFNYGYLFSSLMTGSIVTAGAIMALHGALTMGMLVACVLLSGRIMQPVQRAMALWARYQDFELSRKHVDSLFSLPISVNHYANEQDMREGVEVRNVSFSFGRNSIFNRVNIDLRPGECVSIASEASNGKSTLLKLICGVYRPNSGYVKVNGIDPHTYQSQDLIYHIGYLSASAPIYRGTIYQNLSRFGKTDEAQVREVAGLLGIDKEVSKLPNGYETMLEGSTADSVPPGLKQRIAMARVLACKPKIILFDHADRALDREGYNQVYRLLGRLKGKVTLLIVSSDYNLLRLADTEFVLEDKELHRRPVHHIRLFNINSYRELTS